MNNFEDLLEKFKKEDLIFQQLIDSHFSKSTDKSYEKIELIKYFPLLNQIILNQEKDLIIVAPGKKELAYLTSLFSSLLFFKKNYINRLNNFHEWLKPNSIVSLCSSGAETGKIYKFIDQKDQDYVSLGLIKDASVRIDQKIETLLQFYPIKDDDPIPKQKIGKKGYFPKPSRTPIDELLDINSYGNTLLYENKIIVLTEYYKTFLKFLDNETLLNKNHQSFQSKSLLEIIKCDQIDPEGKLKIKGAEPLILYTRDLSFIYSYLEQARNNQIVICDNIRKIKNNISVFDQIKDSDKNFKFIIFAEENEYDEIKELKNNNNFHVWKFDDNEIQKVLSNTKHDSIDLNKFYAGKIFLKNKNHLNKKEIYLEVQEDIFNNISLHLKKIIKLLLPLEEQSKNLIRDIMHNLHNKLYQLRDHIFGVTKELKKELDEDIKNYFTRLKSTESFLSNDLYDELIKFGNLFEDVEFNRDIFQNRVNEYGEVLKQLKNDDYATLVYDIKRKSYYDSTVKNLWGLEAKSIYSSNTEKIIKNLIIPSDLTRDKIQKLVLNDNFENKYFIGSKVLKADINDEKEFLRNRWKNIIINKTEKCELLNIDKKFEHLFHTTEFLDSSRQNNIENADIGKFFTKEFSDSYNREENDEAETTPAFLIVFNGDSYAFLTENFETEIFNSIFDPSAYEKKKLSIKKNFKNIVFDDIILLRHNTDKEALDNESILISGENKDKYFHIKKSTEEISLIINKCFADLQNIVAKRFLTRKLKEVGYDKHVNNVISLSLFNSGTICPNSFSDLEKIFIACELQNPNFKYDKSKAKEIFNNAKIYKNIRIKAGRSISDKLRKAIKNSKDLEFDGSPLRVDYNDGKVTFGNQGSLGDPEGYIVQVNNYSEPRELKETKLSLTNRLLFT